MITLRKRTILLLSFYAMIMIGSFALAIKGCRIDRDDYIFAAFTVFLIALGMLINEMNLIAVNAYKFGKRDGINEIKNTFKK